ncbi:MAG: hypothetical protein FJ221_09910 [Lentisphaerae bacterium]|nr:hypothetical protein [Lentisphaerota bacterium]
MNRLFLWILATALLAPAARAESTIDATRRHAYGGNVGWIDLRGDGTRGAVLGQSYCTGCLWSANCGWIVLGNGPVNGWQYSNAAPGDWGVNHDGAGRLSGRAWGANVGWIVFEQTHGQPRIDLLTGNLSGSAWGANIGWISLSNGQVCARTERLDPGADSDSDGIPDAWERRRAGNTTTLGGGGADFDRDGPDDVEEYGADTDPLADGSSLALVALSCGVQTNRLTWTASPSRLYHLLSAESLANGTGWTQLTATALAPDASATMTRDIVYPVSTTRFFKVRSVVPLVP